MIPASVRPHQAVQQRKSSTPPLHHREEWKNVALRRKAETVLTFGPKQPDVMLQRPIILMKFRKWLLICYYSVFLQVLVDMTCSLSGRDRYCIILECTLALAFLQKQSPFFSQSSVGRYDDSVSQVSEISIYSSLLSIECLLLYRGSNKGVTAGVILDPAPRLFYLL